MKRPLCLRSQGTILPVEHKQMHERQRSKSASVIGLDEVLVLHATNSLHCAKNYAGTGTYDNLLANGCVTPFVFKNCRYSIN